MSKLKNVTYNTIGFTGPSQTKNGRMDNQQYENDCYLYLTLQLKFFLFFFSIIVGSIILLICLIDIFRMKLKFCF